MRILVCGQKAFGAAAFEVALRRGHEIAAVVAPADSARGNGPDRLRAAAERAGVTWIPSGTLKAETTPAGIDVIISAHSHDFIGRRTRLLARLGAFGYHPSLLPLHRGRDAVRWTVRDGDKVAGGSVYWLSDSIDAGDIAAQDWCFVPRGISPEDLWRDLLFPMGVRLIERTLQDLEGGVIVAAPQDETLASWEPSWGRPPLRRPDLLMLGGLPVGYAVRRDRR